MDDRRTRLPYPDPPLRDGVVRLRRWEGRDLACVEAAATDPRIPSGTTVPAIFCEAKGKAFIERQWGRQSDGEGLSLAIEEESLRTAVGLIALLFRPEPFVAGVGYWVIPEARGRRFAARAVALLAPWALRQASVRRLEALVDPGNLASVRALEGCGFQRRDPAPSPRGQAVDLLRTGAPIAAPAQHCLWVRDRERSPDGRPVGKALT